MDSLVDQLSKLTMNELKQYAKDHKMRGFSKCTRKEQLKEFILTIHENKKNTIPVVNRVFDTSEKLSDINVIDLFCGCGGLTNGFDKRFNIICGIDTWDVAIESYNSNYDHEGICRDLTTYTPKQCDEEIVKGRQIDIVIGGPPCQAYSMGGKRDPNDPRSNLFLEYYAYLKYFKPKVFVMENVIGILSVKDQNNDLLINRILELLNEDYDCCVNKLYAKDFEVPQIRRRVIIIGIRKDLDMKPYPIEPISNEPIAVSTILQKREEVDKSLFLSERAIQGLTSKKNRMKAEGKGFGAQFLDLDKPCYTIPARYWKDGYDALVKYSDTEIRRLSVLELKRVQTFSDDYILCGSKKEQIMQIGNAVACKFGWHIANYVANIFLSEL